MQETLLPGVCAWSARPKERGALRLIIPALLYLVMYAAVTAWASSRQNSSKLDAFSCSKVRWVLSGDGKTGPSVRYKYVPRHVLRDLELAIFFCSVFAEETESGKKWRRNE